ncbi:MAG: PqqD family protein [Acidobacteria bacterium]|nr:PqqD family protein [Acidobacteriota bacterium]
MQTRTPMILIKEQASFTELVDNQEGIILDLDNLHYYTLNSTGVFLWKWMRYEKQSSVESLSAAMADAFNIGSDLAELDASSFSG